MTKRTKSTPYPDKKTLESVFGESDSEEEELKVISSSSSASFTPTAPSYPSSPTKTQEKTSSILKKSPTNSDTYSPFKKLKWTHGGEKEEVAIKMFNAEGVEVKDDPLCKSNTIGWQRIVDTYVDETGTHKITRMIVCRTQSNKVSGVTDGVSADFVFQEEPKKYQGKLIFNTIYILLHLNKLQ